MGLNLILTLPQKMSSVFSLDRRGDKDELWRWAVWNGICLGLAAGHGSLICKTNMPLSSLLKTCLLFHRNKVTPCLSFQYAGIQTVFWNIWDFRQSPSPFLSPSLSVSLWLSLLSDSRQNKQLNRRCAGCMSDRSVFLLWFWGLETDKSRTDLVKTRILLHYSILFP